MLGGQRVLTPLHAEPSVHGVMCLPQPQDGVSIIPQGMLWESPGHLSEVLSANLTGEELLHETCHDSQCSSAGDDGRGVVLPWRSRLGGGVLGVVDGEGKDCEGVHEYPQATRVATKVGEAAITCLPGHMRGEKVRVQLQIKYSVTKSKLVGTSCSSV